MAKRYRANILPGQRAWVGDVSFAPGQLLPEGTEAYSVTGAYVLDEDEEEQYGFEVTTYSIDVHVGASKSEVEEMTLTKIGENLANEVEFGSE